LKAEEDDKNIFENHVNIDAKQLIKAKIPPAPIICLRTQHQIIVQPRNFESIDGVKPCWYTVYASQATPINLKARISDYSYTGCGEQVKRPIKITFILYKIKSIIFKINEGSCVQL
jgi:hypothetical protein